MTTPAINDTAPDFTLKNQSGADIRLSSFRGKWVVLYFYPKDNTSGCTREAIDFSAALPRFTKKGAVILGVSPDSVASHERFVTKQNLTVELLSDPEKTVLRLYGVWQKKKLYGREFNGVVRTTLLIDPDGIIRQRWDKVKVAGHAEEVFEARCALR
jgi:peroxiredoxin Q/BCP